MPVLTRGKAGKIVNEVALNGGPLGEFRDTCEFEPCDPLGFMGFRV